MTLSNQITVAPSSYVKISREIQDHVTVGFGQPVKPADPSRGSYSRAEAWLFLVFQARWKSGEVNNRGKVMTLERGELLGARAWLAKTWNWSENTVKWFLDKLENEAMIKRNPGHEEPPINRQLTTNNNHQLNHQPTTKRTARFVNVLSICNYDIYQVAIAEFCEGRGRLATGAITNQTTNYQPEEKGCQPPESNKENKYNITTVENHNLGLPSLKSAGHEGVFWKEDGKLDAANGTRAALEKLLGNAATLDEVLVDIAPSLPDKATGQELAVIVTGAVVDHARKLEKDKAKRGSRLPKDWKLRRELGQWAVETLGLEPDFIRSEAGKFKDYWIAKPGKDGCKLDWDATWRVWIRKAAERGQRGLPLASVADKELQEIRAISRGV